MEIVMSAIECKAWRSINDKRAAKLASLLGFDPENREDVGRVKRIYHDILQESKLVLLHDKEFNVLAKLLWHFSLTEECTTAYINSVDVGGDYSEGGLAETLISTTVRSIENHPFFAVAEKRVISLLINNGKEAVSSLLQRLGFTLLRSAEDPNVPDEYCKTY